MRAGPGRRRLNVSKIESMLKNATEKAPAAGGLAAAASGGRGRFARDAAEYATATGVRLRVVPGGDPATAPGGMAARLPAPATGPDLPRSSLQSARNHAAACPGAATASSPIPPVLFILCLFFSREEKEKERPLP